MGYKVLSRYRSELMGVAMLWVMCFHAIDLDLGVEFLNFLRAAGFGGVDIFILLSAMGLVMSLERRPQEYGDFMLRRMKRIMPGYLIIMIPYTVFLHFYQAVPWSAVLWNSLLLNYWVHCGGSFNWYISGAMTFYAITPPFHRHFKASRRRELTAACWVLLGLAVCQLLMQEGYWYYVDVFYRFPTFILGTLLGFYVVEERKLHKKDVLFWAAFLALGLFYLAQSMSQRSGGGFRLQMPLCHLFLFTTVPMCLTLCAAFEKLPLRWLQKPLKKMGECSLEIYLFNASIFTQVGLLRKFVHFGPSNRLYYLLMFAVNIALGIGFHHLMEKLAPKRPLQKPFPDKEMLRRRKS